MAIVCSGARPIGYLGTSLSISQDYVAGFANILGVICESKVGGASPERASSAVEQTLEGKADTIGGELAWHAKCTDQAPSPSYNNCSPTKLSN